MLTEVERKYVRAISHPVRVQILAALRGRSMSARDLASALGVSPRSAAYHARTLRALGFVAASLGPARRGRETLFRLVAEPWITDEVWEQTPTIVKEATIASALANISALLDNAVDTGGFDRADAHLTRTRVTLDSAGWTALSAEMQRWLELVDRLGHEAERRLAKRHETAIDSAVVMTLFETPPDLGRPGPGGAAGSQTLPPVVITDADWGRMPAQAKKATSAAAVGRVQALLASAASRGAFNRGDARLTRSGVRLDQQAWSWLAADMARWVDAILRAGDEARPRVAQGERGIDATVSMFLFETAPTAPLQAPAPDSDDDDAAFDRIIALHERIEKLLITGQDWERAVPLLDELRVATRERLLADQRRREKPLDEALS